MALPTYLDLVNDVLIRLREKEVTSVQDTTYSKLIGKFVNDAKKQCENAYNWNALRNSITINTVAGTSNYTLTNAGQRFKVLDVIDTTSDGMLSAETTEQMNQYFYASTPQQAAPIYYSFNGTDTNGDTKVDVYPIPDAVYAIRFSVYKPQDTLSTDSTTVLIPTEPIILGALARAIAERGEDGGLASNEMYILYTQALADAISIESGRTAEQDEWFPI